MPDSYTTIPELQNQICKDVIIDRDKDEVIFSLSNGKRYKLYHYQDCCESVSIHEVVGDPKDLISFPLLLAEEATNEGKRQSGYWTNSYLWTFYKFATVKGYLTLSWYGESNGYYSEGVNFEEIKKEGDIINADL